jgi:hypothetical protein
MRAFLRLDGLAAGLEDQLGADLQGQRASGFKAQLAVALGQRQQPKAGTVAVQQGHDHYQPVEYWHAWIGDATIADAILDRIMQRNHRFTLTGDSLRAERPKTSRKEKNIDPS